MYKKAIKLKLRFETSRGMLSVEQLWDLSQDELASIIRNLKELLRKDSDDELDFLENPTTKADELIKLQFDIVKDVYLDKKSAIETEQKQSENKIHNQKILELIKRKQDSDLGELSIEELEGQLR